MIVKFKIPDFDKMDFFQVSEYVDRQFEKINKFAENAMDLKNLQLATGTLMVLCKALERLKELEPEEFEKMERNIKLENLLGKMNIKTQSDGEN